MERTNKAKHEDCLRSDEASPTLRLQLTDVLRRSCQPMPLELVKATTYYGVDAPPRAEYELILPLYHGIVVEICGRH